MANRSDRRRRLQRRLDHLVKRDGGNWDTAEASALSWILQAEADLRDRLAKAEAERDEARSEAAQWRGVVETMEEHQDCTSYLTDDEKVLPWEGPKEDGHDR